MSAIASISVTPLIEQSHINSPVDLVVRADLELGWFDRSFTTGVFTYIRNKVVGELFLYDALDEIITVLSEEDQEYIADRVREEIANEFDKKNLVPLYEFYCDKCGEIVATDDAIIEFYQTSAIASDGSFTMDPTGFRIVHYNTCMYTDEDISRLGMVASMPFKNHSDTLGELMYLLEKSINTSQEIIEIIKRVQIPYYEEARKQPDKLNESIGSLRWPQYKYHRSNLRRVAKD